MAKRSISWMALVAEKLEVTEEWVRDLIREKKIRATNIGQWRIKLEDLAKFVKKRSNF